MMYNNNLEEYNLCLCGNDSLHNILSTAKKVKYHDKTLDVDNWYYTGTAFLIECNHKEYEIFNSLNLYVVEEIEKDYIQIYDVVE